jgi:Phage integrase family
MTTMSVLDAAGRRRSPATMPGYHAGRPPRNKGIRYPADPPTVDEIVAVMRHTNNDRHGWRLRAMIVVLWRAGLRVHESLALTEHDLDQRRGSILVRRGKGGRRREVGMDEWGWEQLRPWLAARVELPVGPLVLHHRRPDPRAAVVERRGPSRVPAARRPGGRATAVRAASAAPRARARARSRGRAAEHHPAPTRACQPRHHLDLSPGHRSRGNHHRGAHAAPADDVRQRRAAALIHSNDRGRAGARPRSRFARAKQASAHMPPTLSAIVQLRSLGGVMLAL